MSLTRITAALVGAAVLSTVVGARQPAPPPGSLHRATERAISVNAPLPLPAWAFAERALLDSTVAGARAWSERYLDANGALKFVPHWGVSDGPDDVMETIRLWPLAYALGAPDALLPLFENAWEGHLQQYSQAKLPGVELARDGIYYKEFITSFDWEHTGEGLQAFYWYGLARPTDPVNAMRARRFAGFYMNEDPDAPNYDPQHRIIRSLFNGSRGPKLTPATPVDWDGDADPKRAARFATASNIRGDHPLNLLATTLAAQAYLLTHDAKYRSWLLEYVNAWRDRAAANNGNFPSNIGLDGTIGGEWGGKWYGGIFGWNSPDEGIRNYVLRGPPVAFAAALLLTGDQQYVDVLRRQIDNIYAAKRVENGKVLIPHYYGPQGWYGYKEGEFHPTGALGNLSDLMVDIYFWSFKAIDRDRMPENEWAAFVLGKNPEYPLRVLAEDFEAARRAAQRMRDDRTTYGFPVTSGVPRGYGASPVAVESLVRLTMGANNLYGSGDLLHAQTRYFDPERHRAGLPQDVAALIDSITPEGITLTLANTSPLTPHTVTVQMGAYGEHECVSVTYDGKTTNVGAPYFDVRLAPGAVGKLTIAMKRYVNDPTLAFPWDRGWWDDQPPPAPPRRLPAAANPARTTAGGATAAPAAPAVRSQE